MKANDVTSLFGFEWEESGCKIKITFSIEDSLAISLPKAPYAGFALHGTWSPSSINLAIESLLTKCLKQGLKKIIIRQRPNFDVPSINQEILHQTLIKNNFSFTNEINQHVMLNNSQLNLHSMQARKIKKCKEKQLVFVKESINNLGEVYNFLSTCREQQGLSINISKNRLEQLLVQLPTNYECFAIRNHEQQLMAATVIVIVNEEVVYNYLPGFDRSFKSLSPLSFLLKNLYDLLKNREYRVFDLGLSSIQGTLQNGLFTYKERMGAIQSNRYVYERSL